MGSAEWVAIAIVLVFAGASFFFSLAESALFSLNKWQAKRMAGSDAGRGLLVERLLTDSQGVLATMVLGNTFANAAMLSTGLWMALEGHWPLAVTIILIFLLTLVGCEVMPKTLAVRHPERWALRVAHPVNVLQRLATPLNGIAEGVNTRILRNAIPKSIKPYSGITEEDYQEVLELAFQQGALDQSERDIILQIVRLDRRTAKDVMRPRSQMAAIPDDLTIEEMVAEARKHRCRRLPIYDETPDTIVGVLNARAFLLDPEMDLADAIELPSFVPESMNLLQLMKSLQQQQRGLAIVLDEFGGTAGTVTLEDILELVIGRTRGEVLPEGFLLQKLGPGKWKVSGNLRLDDFRREYPALPEAEEIDTMNGLILHLMQVVPARGEWVTCGNLRLTAQATDERRVREVLVEVVQ